MKKYILLSFYLFVFNQQTFSQDLNAPKNLEVELATLGGVQLSWDHPPAFSREIITKSNQNYLIPNYNYAIGSAYNGYHHFVFHKIDGDSLADYHGLTLERLAFKAGPDSATFHAHIYTPEKGQEPDYIYKSDMVLTGQFVSLTDGNLIQNDWNYIDLTTFQPGIAWEQMLEPSSYTIDSTKDLWYGYYVSFFDGNPIGMDNGPANLGYGDVQVFCGGTTVDSITCNPVSPNVDRNFLMTLQLKGENQTNDVDNYYVFQNGTVVEIVEPSYLSPVYSGRERVNFGPVIEGNHTFAVRALTSEGISDSTNNVTVNIVNSLPGPFEFISPSNGSSFAFEQSTLSNQISFIWTPSVDIDGLDLDYTISICNSDTFLCIEQTLEERIYQPYVWMLMGQLSLVSGINQLHWSVFSSDGLDTTFANDSIFTFSIDLSSLSIDDLSLNPQKFILNQNYPNPFNPVTTISYQIEKGEFVNLSIFDLNGNLIKNVLDQYVNAGPGIVHWNGKNNSGQNVSGGIYLYSLESSTFSKTKKMILLK
ncbi:T9SS type A sorting domain-containing protein [bacterium]|nr:T9SS type A sorting domain-containing protein [bacterium]